MTDRAAPSRAGVLAAYGGARPPAPMWFDRAIGHAPARGSFDGAGAAIELLTWGQVGKPGLLFLHGDSAHADWWSFIAPFFAAEWRCAAISWSGMGGSAWRTDGYPFDRYADEAIAAIDAAALDDGSGVMVVAHSLGGYPALIAGARSGRIRGIIAVDSAIVPPRLQDAATWPVPRPHRLYASQAEALARFRFLPPEVGEADYIIDHVARAGMVEEPGGWRWRFDPAIWGGMTARSDLDALPGAARCPLALLIGAHSALIRGEVLAHMRSLYPADAPFIVVPEAGHHVMIDQPLALVAAIRACLAMWPSLGSSRGSAGERRHR